MAGVETAPVAAAMVVPVAEGMVAVPVILAPAVAGEVATLAVTVKVAALALMAAPAAEPIARTPQKFGKILHLRNINLVLATAKAKAPVVAKAAMTPMYGKTTRWLNSSLNLNPIRLRNQPRPRPALQPRLRLALHNNMS